MKVWAGMLLSAAACLLAGGIIAKGVVLPQGKTQKKQTEKQELYMEQGDILNDIADGMQEAMQEEIANDFQDEWDESMEEDDETEETAENQIRATIQNDTSTGKYQMYEIVEDGDYIYYTEDEEGIYRQKLDGSSPELVIPKAENGGIPGKILVTDQYIYVVMHNVGLDNLVQYTKDGRKVGVLLDGDVYPGEPYMQYENGWFYYKSANMNQKSNLYRIRAQYGSEAEQVMEEQIGDFQVDGDVIYYINENDRLARMNTDGTGQQVLDEELEFQEGDLRVGKLHNQRLYYYYTSYDTEDQFYFCKDLNSLTDVNLHLDDSEDGYPWRGAYFIQDKLVYLQFESEIWAYDPETQENTCIIDVNESNVPESLSFRYVPGATRLYFRYKVYLQDEYKWEEKLYCMDLNGSEWIELGEILDYPIVD